MSSCPQSNALTLVSAVLEGESPKEFLKRFRPPPGWDRMTGLDRQIGEYSLDDYGIEHQQYWQGVSTMHTDWDEVYVGIGDNPHEAADDAISQASEDWETGPVANEMPTEPTVSGEMERQAKEEAANEVSRDDYESDEDYQAAIEEKAQELLETWEWELSYYVVLWVRGFRAEDAEQAESLREADEAPGAPEQPVAGMGPRAFLKQLRGKSPVGWPIISRWYRGREGEPSYRRAFTKRMRWQGGQRVERNAPLRNTRFVRYRNQGGEEHALRFHHTDVLRYKPDGSIEVRTGGWKTNTTKERINTFSPYGWKLSQYQYGWYWWNHKWPQEISQQLWADMRARRRPKSKYWLPFNDGDTIRPDGTLQFQGGTATPEGQVNVAESVQEGRYLRKLAWIKRAKAKHEKMREVKKRQKEIEDLDKPEKQEESAKDFILGLGKRGGMFAVNQEVSTGTLNTRDLIGTFLETIEHFHPARYQDLVNDQELQDYLEGRMERDDAQDFEDHYLHEVLVHEMSQFCPPGTYFGSHPGSSADIGCWPLESHDYEDLAEQGRIIYCKESDTEQVEKIRAGDFSAAPQAEYAIVESDYYSYTCYDREGRVLWQC